ncbi:hypothetical protein SAMN05720606_11086 [Paenibacillus polysaccharolyticus]|uniref:Uncharacterized protein n=1 Tax=Paenibacillus polysaccharolyticus TaxID=582692 RepID=A0A1G5J7P0_9BACL|nr:hypothetical protein SAMN05720606_11086 [Paenibacillus polysaccharolyticus]
MRYASPRFASLKDEIRISIAAKAQVQSELISNDRHGAYFAVKRPFRILTISTKLISKKHARKRPKYSFSTEIASLGIVRFLEWLKPAK